MTIQTPTRITIEIHQPEQMGGALDGSLTGPIVRVLPETGVARATSVVVGEPREDAPLPAAYEPDPCTCLDGQEDCTADHGND
jgi:hypothetical protein